MTSEYLSLEADSRPRARLSSRTALSSRSGRRSGSAGDDGRPPDWTELASRAYVTGASSTAPRLGACDEGLPRRSGGPGTPAAVDWAGRGHALLLQALLPESARPATRWSPGGVCRRDSEIGPASPVPLPPRDAAAREYRVYLGPKESARPAVGGNLAKPSRGWFFFFFPPLRTSSRPCSSRPPVIPNYGVAISLITVVVRLLVPVMQRQMQ